MLLDNFNQSGVIPFRINNGGIEILLITSRKKKNWIVPKGIIEDDLSPQDSAEKEALEEAGVEGKVFQEKIGEYEFQKWGGVCVVKLFVMRVEKENEIWLEGYERKRKWFLIREALKHIKRKKLRKIIKSVPEFLEKNQ